MLLPWSDIWMYRQGSLATLFKRELRVTLTADYVETQLISRNVLRGFKPEIVTQAKTMLTQPLAAMEVTPALLAVLEQMLEQTLAQFGRANVVPVVILSGELSRYLVVPWNDAIRTKAETEAYIIHLFAQNYGEASADWHLATHHARYGHPAFVSAIPNTLLTVLKQVFIKAGLTLKAIHPQWMITANKALTYLRQQRLPADGWVACVESTRLTMGRMEAGEWLAVQSLPLESFIAAQIEKWVARASVITPTTADMPILVDDVSDTAGSIKLSQYRVIDLAQSPTTASAPQVMSMVGRAV